MESDGDGDGAPANSADGGSPGTTNEGGLDAGLDAEIGDGGEGPVEDAGGVRGPAPFGTLSGDLGVLDTELSSVAPALFVNHFDLGTLASSLARPRARFDPTELSKADLARLTPGARRMLEEGGLFVSFRELGQLQGARALRRRGATQARRQDRLRQRGGGRRKPTTSRRSTAPGSASP